MPSTSLASNVQAHQFESTAVISGISAVSPHHSAIGGLKLNRVKTSTADTQTYHMSQHKAIVGEMHTIKGYASRKEVDSKIPKLYNPVVLSPHEALVQH